MIEDNIFDKIQYMVCNTVPSLLSSLPPFSLSSLPLFQLFPAFLCFIPYCLRKWHVKELGKRPLSQT
ncbi:MAG: hypothetical protein ACI90V_005765 [Bacillariaceae sp.]|jgi:hypothetical protein